MLKAAKRILKYSLAVLVISVFFQSMAILVIHYSERKQADGTSRPFHNAAILQFDDTDARTDGESFLRRVQETAARRIQTDRMVVQPVVREIPGVMDEVRKHSQETVERLTSGRIEDILRSRRNPTQASPAETINPLPQTAEQSIDAILRRKSTPSFPQNLTKQALIASVGADPSVDTMTEATSSEPPPPADVMKPQPGVQNSPMLSTLAAESNPTAEPAVDTYVVSRGDSLIRIAKKFKMSVDELRAMNQIKGSLIMRGQKLKVRVSDIAVTAGRLASLSTFAANGTERDTPHDRPATRITEPAKSSSSSKKKSSKIGRILNKANDSRRIFQWPLRGTVSSPYGMRLHPVHRQLKMHTGIDIACGNGTNIRAVAAGTIKFAGWMSGYGRIVIIRHANGFETRYAHCSRFLVKRGDKVNTGDKVARSGSSGTATGPHLHFEVRKRGRHLNPITYLTSR